ncbi:MAG: GntR family transcriptional regulator [Pseudomonadota bacterium]
MSDQVFEIILNMILKLELRPRSHLSEAQLAKDLGVSRTPVREAFQKLESLGFLDIVPQRGSTVAPIRVSAFRRSQFMREAFELALVRRATELEDNNALCKAIQREIKLQEVLSEIGDEAAFFLSDEAFHAAIAKHCGLEDVWPEVLRAKLYMDRFRHAVYSQRDTQTILVQHKEIAEAICARDTNAAVDAMTRHLRRANHMLEEAVKLEPETFEMDVASG